jgi:hypothetical protein
MTYATIRNFIFSKKKNAQKDKKKGLLEPKNGISSPKS